MLNTSISTFGKVTPDQMAQYNQMTNSQMNGERMSNEMPRDQTTSKQMTNSDQMKLTDCKKQLLYELA